MDPRFREPTPQGPVEMICKPAPIQQRCFIACVSCAVLVFGFVLGLGAGATTQAQQDSVPRKLHLEHLPNAIEVREGLISGGLPETMDAFDELRRLGIKTVISVDGMRPDVQMAERYSMRYVHIPHSYDGIPDATLEALTKAISELPGPIYIHCHHGKHRSPTAAAAACVAQGTLGSASAMRVLELAGTNPAYKGLFQTVQKAKPMDALALAKLRIDFPSACDVPPLVEAMIDLEATFSKLNKVSLARWRDTSDVQGIDAAHEAVLLRKHFEEMQRLEGLGKYPGEFKQMLKESEQAAWFIESMLNPGFKQVAVAVAVADTGSTAHRSELGRLEGGHRKALEINWGTIRANCTGCHQQFRDKPK